ncbi:hypothetical protein N9Y42_06905 [Mariniblastus sp.]|nr:hypothetical protein [Mariniblastus sp.]
MLNEFDEPEKFEHDPDRLPPDLAEIESRLGALRQASPSTLDRDELMFQSGYAAALAAKEPCPPNLQSRFAKVAWPALSGSLGVVAAVLAVLLWAAPVATQSGPVASKPAEVPVEVGDVETVEPIKVFNANDAVASATTNPIEAAISPYLGNVFRLEASDGSVLEFRNRRLANLLSDEPERPRRRTGKTRPRMEPLRATSFQNQQLWGQL